MLLQRVFDQLLTHYGPQHWWPGDTSFEIMVGAILTQNTAWGNVEKAIVHLKGNDALDAAVIAGTAHAQLAGWLKPSGYFNIKATRLQNFCRWYLAQGGFSVLQQWPTDRLRRGLLSVNGVGPETADDMLLYAFKRPVFVIDAYTRRLFSRLGILDGKAGYEDLRRHFETTLPADAGLFNEFHALIVRHAKGHCRKRPLCEACPLVTGCAEPAG